MLFKGSEAFPKGEIDTQIARNGGAMNGFTWLDFTTFFETLPSDRIDLSLHIEADRMVNALFDPRRSSRSGRSSFPSGRGPRTAPLFCWARRSSVRPSGFILTITTRSATCATWKRSATTTYGATTRPTMAPTTPWPWPSAISRRRRCLPASGTGSGRSRLAPNRGRSTAPSRRSEASAASGWKGQVHRLPAGRLPRPGGHRSRLFSHAGSYQHPDRASGMNLFAPGPPNRSSRLYKALVETGLAAGISGSLPAMLDPFLYDVTVTVRTGRTLDEVEAVLDAEIDRSPTSRLPGRSCTQPSNKPKPSLPILPRASPTRGSGWAIRRSWPTPVGLSRSWIACAPSRSTT